jgi:hypothetical protein
VTADRRRALAFTLGGLRQVCGAGPPTLLLRRCRVHGIHDAEQEGVRAALDRAFDVDARAFGEIEELLARSGGPAM